MNALYFTLFFNRKVYDVKIESLPLADLTESTTPVFCDVCMKKNERSKAQSYCTDCRKCLCTKHVQVWMCVLCIGNISITNLAQHSIVFPYAHNKLDVIFVIPVRHYCR